MRSQPSVAHLEKLAALTEISEFELWLSDNTESALVKRLKAKAMEILRKSKPRVICKCDDAMDVEPGTYVEPELVEVRLEEDTKPVVCRCRAPRRVFRLKHLIRKHGQWGTPFWGSERVEEVELPPLED